MKVLVMEHPRIASEKHFNDIANTPLWSCLMGGYVAAALGEAGFDVLLLDATGPEWTFQRAAEMVIDADPGLLCINGVYMWEQADSLFRFISGLKEQGFRGHTNLFGFFPTLAWRAIMKGTEGVDSIALGECEITIEELARAIEGGHADLGHIPGIAHSGGRGLKVIEPRHPVENPDIFPFPLRPTQQADETVTILASRGCYNQCTFCLIPPFYDDGPLWRGRTPGNVIEEMAGLAGKGHRSFYFADANFIGPGKKGRERTELLLDLMKPLGIRFGMETRPNDLDEAIMARLRDAGLETLLLGIESGSASVLGALDKHGSRNASERAINICRDAGIEPEVGFLMFVPDSTLDDLDQNFAFLMDNALLDRLDRTANLLSHRQIIFTGTSGFARFEAEGRLTMTGFLGSQGEVPYRDERVRWVSERIIAACLSVLREMSRPESALFWKNGSEKGTEKEKMNDYLVDLFRRLLSQARSRDASDPADYAESGL